MEQAFRLFGMATGFFATVWTGTLSAVAQDTGAGYRPAAAAPAMWQAFAKGLQSRLEYRLARDDDSARRAQDAIAKHEQQRSANTLSVRAWVSRDGRVERLEFDGLNDDVATNLRALLAGVTVGEPPADMLQPLHLRLALRPTDHQKD